MVDVAIIGGGPAGLSAAVNVCARAYSCMVLSNDIASNPLANAPRIDNYIGMRGRSGLSVLQRMKRDALAAGVKWQKGHVLSVAALGNYFMIAVGNDVIEARRVILATGIHAPQPIPGETELLGRGVSYCATCDGALYRGKRAVVIGDADDLAKEAVMLYRLGVQVTVAGKDIPPTLPAYIPFVYARRFAVSGGGESPVVLTADDELMPCDIVFILRNEVAADTLVPGLETNGRFICTDQNGCTNIRGLYAAGDCTGRPLQIAKAVGQGLIAAFAATDSLAEEDRL